MNRLLKNALALVALVLLVAVSLPVAAASLFAVRTAFVPVLAVGLVAAVVWPKARHALTN